MGILPSLKYGFNPVAPTLIRSTDHNQYPLCNIYVKAGVTEITQSNITNLVGTGSCPFITGILESIDIEDLVSQWEAQWDEFYSAQTLDMQLTADEWKKQWNDWYTVQTAVATADMEKWMSDRQADFNYWWSQMQAILDGDVAANLAQRVLKLEENFGILATEFKVHHTSNVRAANSLYPTSMAEYERRREYQNNAIVNCEQLIKELQRVVEIFEVDINLYNRYVKAIDREIDLIKKWRQRDNKIKSHLQGNV